MTIKTKTGALLLCLMLAGAAAHAETIEDALVAQLHEQGYASVQVTRTFLGRIRIDAKLGDMRREIVLNPHTGEILRDYQGMIRVAEESDDDDKGPVASGAPVAVTATGDEKSGPVPELLDPGITSVGDGAVVE